jgi:hypothetical protein
VLGRRRRFDAASERRTLDGKVRKSLLVLLALATTAPATAQDVGRFELGIFGGASIGSRISLTPGSDIRIGDAGAFGLRGAYDLGRHFALEATFSHTRPNCVPRRG